MIPLALAPNLYSQGVALTNSGFYSQNFDTLPIAAGVSWTNYGTLPGWLAQTDTTPNPLPIGIFNGGGGAVSGFLSMGFAGNTDRAIGFRPTTSNYGMTLLGLVVRNDTASPMTIGHVDFNGELWRTQDTANNVDGYQFFYQVGTAAPTDLGPFTVNNGGTYAANAAVEDAGWIRVPSLEYTDVDAVAASSLATPRIKNVALNFMGVTLQPGQVLTFRWRNPNDTAGDAVMGIDDFGFSYTVPGANLVYNPAHTVGGGPNGVLTPSAAGYWLNGGNVSGFAMGDSVTFSQDATATITVPANTSVSNITVSAQSGTYTIGGPGRLEGSLVKSGAGSLVLNGPTAFNDVALNDGGKITAQGVNGFNANTLQLAAGGTLEIGGDATIFQAVTGTGPLTKTGAGVLRLAGSASNTYTGATLVSAGVLEGGKTAGVVAIPGGLTIEAGATFRYTGNAGGNQIADTASITINGGSFGDMNFVAPTNPGAPETVTNVTLNGGNFSTGRATFTATNDFVSTGGTVHVVRGGVLLAGNQLTIGGTMRLDGGSTTAGQESRVITGAGGLVLHDATVNLNSGPSALTAGSMGSVIALGGPLTSTGNTTIARFNAATVTTRADLDLQGTDRTFDVTGNLIIGAPQATVVITNGGIIKAGTGVLTLGGSQTYTQPTLVNAGKFLIDGTISSPVTVGNAATFGGTGNAFGPVQVSSGGRVEPGIAGVGALTLSTLTFGAGAGDTAALNIPLQPVTPLVVSSPNGLVANGSSASVTINVSGEVTVLGQQTLLDYEGVIGGTGFGAFVLGTLPNRVQAVLVNDPGSTALLLDVTKLDRPIWSGALSTEWSTATLGNPKNWVLQSNQALSTDFLTNDDVLFQDGGNPTIDVSVEDVSPAQVRFGNFTTNYTITGTKAIAGSGGLIKDGAGTVTITNANSFTGPVVIAAGTIKTGTLTNTGTAGPLGAGSSIVLDGGVLEITGANTSTNRTVTVNTSGTLTAEGQVTLAGSLSGFGVLSKGGSGRVVLSGNNSGFNGRLNVSAGSVRFTGGSIGGNTVTVALDGGTLENDDVVETIFNDAGALLRSLEIGTSGATLNVVNAAGAIAFQRVAGVSGTGTIRKTGPGIVRMQASSSGLSANWIMDEGVLEVGAPDALGTGNVIVAAGLLATRNVTVNSPVTLQGGGLGTRTGDVGDFAGPVTVNTASDVFLRSYTTPAQPHILTVSGVLSGAGDLRILGNANPVGTDYPFTVTNPGNTYTGTFRVAPGQSLMSRALTPGNPLGAGVVALTDARLSMRSDGLGDNGTIPLGNAVTIAGTTESRIDVDRVGAIAVGNTFELGSLTIGSQKLVVTGANQYRVAFSQAVTLTQAPTFEPTTADLVLHGDISGNFGFSKTGAGRLVIDGSTTFTGAVSVQAGTMQWNATTADTVDVQVGGGTLAGTGTIGDDLTFSGASTFEPGEALRGILRVKGDLTLHAGSAVRFDLAHTAGVQPVPGTDYAQVRVGGPTSGVISLNDAPLSLTLAGGVQQDDLFFLILNDGVSPVGGIFAGLPQDSVFILGGQNFQISYTANEQTQSLVGGNDIALQAIPEPGCVMLIAGGFMFCAAGRRRAPGRA